MHGSTSSGSAMLQNTPLFLISRKQLRVIGKDGYEILRSGARGLPGKGVAHARRLHQNSEAKCLWPKQQLAT